jgi:hypothetical protein
VGVGAQDGIIAIDDFRHLLPTGADLDGDGGSEGCGRQACWGRGCLDRPGRRVIHAELLAARALIRQLDPQTTRVGILTFAEEIKVLAPLGSPDAALAWLDQYEIHGVPARRVSRPRWKVRSARSSLSRGRGAPAADSAAVLRRAADCPIGDTG